MKTGLVLEGGAIRTIFSSGVCDAFLDAELPLPDYTLGVSAGIAYGVSYLSRQNRRNLQLVTTYANDPRYMGWRNMADRNNRSYFGMEFVYDTIPNELIPFDYDAFAAYPGVAEAVVTNLDTGRAEYLPVDRGDRQHTILRASCAIPLMFPAIEVNGQAYYDGGCADPIPWRRAFEMGCDRVVVVLTRERDYRKKVDRTVPVIERTLRKHPEFVDCMRHRAEYYNACREELFALEKAGRVIVLAPEDTYGCSRTERDIRVIRKLWQEGYFAARRKREEIRAFWTEE